MMLTVKGGKFCGISSFMGTAKVLAQRSRSVLIHLSLSVAFSLVSLSVTAFSSSLEPLTLDVYGGRISALAGRGQHLMKAYGHIFSGGLGKWHTAFISPPRKIGT